MICDLTGLDIANASLLDEATAAAEAMTLAQRARQGKGDTLLRRPATCHPQTIEWCARAPRRWASKLVVGDPREPISSRRRVRRAAAISRHRRRDPRLPRAAIASAARPAGALSIVAADLLALTLLEPPGEFGADVAVGSAQRFGVPLGYGGPHAAFFACRDELKRQMPGRIVGVSNDAHGKPAYRLALQTREQHIRREKATTNICTAQVLLAIMAACTRSITARQG